jgi:hypothetical protein
MAIIPLMDVAAQQAPTADRKAKESVLAMAEHARQAATLTINRLRDQLGMEPEMSKEEELMGLLWECEWGGKANPYHHICPLCGASRAVSHERTCRLKAVLR